MRKKYLELIKKCEKEIEISDWEINNIKIWPILKFLFYLHRETDYKAESIRNIQKISQFSKIRKNFRQFKNWLIFHVKDYKGQEKNWDKRDICFFFDNSSRYLKINNKFFAPIIDSYKDYLESLQYSTFSIEYGEKDKLMVPRYSKSKMILLSLFLQKLFLKINQKIRKKNFSEYFPHYVLFQEIIEQYGYSEKIKKETIIYNSLLVERWSKYFIKKLKKIQPKLAFINCFYNPESFAFILACKQLHIPTVDIQHGLQGEMHFAYSTWETIPAGGYDLLPDFFWVWSTYEKRVIDSWIEKSNAPYEAIYGGDLWLEQWKELYSKVQVNASKYGPFINEIQKKAEQTIIWLITLQPDEKYQDFIQIIKKLPPTMIWLIRFHPRSTNRDQISQDFHTIDNREIYIKPATELPLPLLLGICSIHLTVSSSVVIEASKYGIKSICLDPESQKIFPFEFQNEMAYFLRNIEEILDFVNSNVKTSRKDITKERKTSTKKKLIDFLSKFSFERE